MPSSLDATRRFPAISRFQNSLDLDLGGKTQRSVDDTEKVERAFLSLKGTFLRFSQDSFYAFIS